MRWLLKQTNLLDVLADVLVCSANVSLNLSGGVGADLLERYGSAMQKALHEMLAKRSPKAARRGEVFPYGGPEIPYRAVLHAVSVDGWDHSNSSAITDIARRALKMAADYEAKRVALTVLGTGFGDLSFGDFAEGIRPVMKEECPPIETVTLGLLLEFEIAALRKCLPQIECS